MGFQHVAFLPSRASFCITFHEYVMKVVALGSPHVSGLWLG